MRAILACKSMSRNCARYRALVRFSGKEDAPEELLGHQQGPGASLPHAKRYGLQLQGQSDLSRGLEWSHPV